MDPSDLLDQEHLGCPEILTSHVHLRVRPYHLSRPDLEGPLLLGDLVDLTALVDPADLEDLGDRKDPEDLGNLKDPENPEDLEELVDRR